MDRTEKQVKLIRLKNGKWYFEIDCVGYGYFMSVDYDTEVDACRAAHMNEIAWIEPDIRNAEDLINV